MYKLTGRSKRSNPHVHLLAKLKIQKPETQSLMSKIENKCTKFHDHAATLECLSKQLDVSQSTHMGAKANRTAVSLLGDAVSFCGVLAAPFSGGVSLLLTGASTAMSIGGSVAASGAQSSLDSDTKTIMQKVEDCISKIKRDQQELEAFLQDFDALMNYFREYGAEKIMTFIEKRECSLNGKDCGKVIAMAQPLFDTLTSAAQFVCALKSMGTKTVVYSVLTIRFLLYKSEVIIKYIPDAIFSRAALLKVSQMQAFASVSSAATTGNQAVRATSKMSTTIIEKSQPVGRNIMIKSKEMKVMGNIQRTSRTVVKKAGTISKVGVGLCVLSTVIDGYCFIKAASETHKHHPEYENVRFLAEEIRSWSRDVQAKLDEFKSKYDDMRLLHNELIAIVDDMHDRDELDMASDEVDDILTYLGRSAQVL